VSQGSWKKHLLRSGLPLEYEVAQAVSQLGMSISADFSFMRREGNTDKESSVDLESFWYDEPEPNFLLRLLIECKYRSPNKNLLFLSDPSEYFPPATLGGTLRNLDFACPISIPLNSSVELENNFEIVYKGIEISDEGAHSSEFWHGIQQLRYGTPLSIQNIIDNSIFGHPEDVIPIFFASILVTNAPIIVLNSGCKMSDIESAKCIDDISKRHDCVIFYSDYGPDYEDHFRRIFLRDGKRRLIESIDLKKRLENMGKKIDHFNDPVKIIQSLQESERYITRAISTQFFVVTLSGFEGLIRRIQASCRDAFDGRAMPDKRG
jgi:hypothetical protein